MEPAFDELRQAATSLHVSEQIQATAERLFQQVSEKADNTGHSLSAIAAATLTAAAQLHKSPVLRTEVADCFEGVSESGIEDEIKRVRKTISVGIPVETPSMIVPEVATAVDATDTTQTVASRVAEKLEAKNECVGKSPSGIAAAIVYFATAECPWEHKRPQHQVADAVGRGEVTVRQHYHTIKEQVDIASIIDDVRNDTS